MEEVLHQDRADGTRPTVASCSYNIWIGGGELVTGLEDVTRGERKGYLGSVLESSLQSGCDPLD
jgi:hypothetical protein